MDSLLAELDRPEFHDPKVLALEEQEPEDHSGPQMREELARLTEETVARNRAYRWSGQALLASERLGQPMSLGEFLRRIRRISPAFWVSDFGAAGMVGLWRDNQYICGVQPGVMPEFSQLRVNEWGVPTKEKYRGWRTVLLNLIQKQAITEAQAHKLFGRPESPAASAYLARLQDFRRLSCTS